MPFHQLFGRFDRDVVVLASEDEELGNLRGAQHLVPVLAGDHAVEQRYDSFVLGDGNLFGEVLDVVFHPGAVVLGEARFGGHAGQRILFPGLYEGDFAAAVFGLLRRVGVGCRT